MRNMCLLLAVVVLSIVSESTVSAQDSTIVAPKKHNNPTNKPVYKYPSKKPDTRTGDKPVKKNKSTDKPAYSYQSKKPVYKYPTKKPVYKYSTKKPLYKYSTNKPLYKYSTKKPVYKYPSKKPVYKYPTKKPICPPTIEPTTAADLFTSVPSSEPSNDPTFEPSSDPTLVPSLTLEPSISFGPTSDPTLSPSSEPTTAPTSEPSEQCICQQFVDAQSGFSSFNLCFRGQEYFGYYGVNDVNFTTNFLVSNPLFPDASALPVDSSCNLRYDNKQPLNNFGVLFHFGGSIYHNLYLDAATQSYHIVEDCTSAPGNATLLSTFPVSANACPAPVVKKAEIGSSQGAGESVTAMDSKVIIGITVSIVLAVLFAVATYMMYRKHKNNHIKDSNKDYALENFYFSKEANNHENPVQNEDRKSIGSARSLSV